MHESSLIQFTLDAVEERCAQMGIGKVRRITLIIGEMRGAVPTLMDKAFLILRKHRPLFQDAELAMIIRPVKLRCEDSSAEFTPADFQGVHCPECGSGRYAVVQGNELLIESFEAG